MYKTVASGRIWFADIYSHTIYNGDIYLQPIAEIDKDLQYKSRQIAYMCGYFHHSNFHHSALQQNKLLCNFREFICKLLPCSQFSQYLHKTIQE